MARQQCYFLQSVLKCHIQKLSQVLPYLDCTPASDQHNLLHNHLVVGQEFSVLQGTLALQGETFLVVPKMTLGLDYRKLTHLSEILNLVKGISK